MTAAMFLWCWTAPQALGKVRASELALLMYFEFFALHAGLLIGVVAMYPGMGTGTRVGWAVLLGVAYVLAVAALAYKFSTAWWWPVLALGWLVGARIASVFSGTGAEALAIRRQWYFWSASMLYYFLGVAIVIFLPIPRLGFEHSPFTRLAQFKLPAHEIVAWGFIYFSALAITALLERSEWYEHGD